MLTAAAFYSESKPPVNHPHRYDFLDSVKPCETLCFNSDFSVLQDLKYRVSQVFAELDQSIFIRC